MRFSYLPDGGATYVTSQGDVLDLIAFNFYGTHDHTTEALYEANRELASVAQPFAAGVSVYLPPLITTQPPAQINLWD